MAEGAEVPEFEPIAVIGLGYVGLPVAAAFARHFNVIGYDADPKRVAALAAGHDWTGEVSGPVLGGLERLRVTDAPGDLTGAGVFIIAVPTPVDGDRRPDLTALLKACDDVGGALSPGALVIVESTVYPGVTEEICGPRLAQASGLIAGVDFKLAYSPERINPGDPDHGFETVIKVVSGQDAEARERAAALYGRVVEAGIHRAPSIKVAEAAKVIENTQRDLNIALMNELAIIFHRLGIPTRDVLAAAGTKWNFLRFSPGLVGGHCIGVDPYYLTAKAEACGYHPEVILAGRRINDGMGQFVARELMRFLSLRDRPASTMRVAILGLTFKENVPDIRNSKVPDIVEELAGFGVTALVHDPLADPAQVRRELRIDLADWQTLGDLDALVLAVPHRAYLERSPAALCGLVASDGIVFDVKGVLDREALPKGLTYWSL